MERITNRCAKELKSYKLTGGLCLILLVFMISYMFLKHNATTWGICRLSGMLQCLRLLGFPNKRKSVVAQEINRLRELLGN